MTADSLLSAPAVSLRPLASGDRERLFDWRNRPEVARWMYSDHAISVAEHARWFAAASRDETRRYWIVELDGAPVGLANLYGIDPRNSRCAWAYYLAADDARGKGVGAAVEFLVLEHVFLGERLDKLWCEVLAENEAVTALHRSFGFTQEALFRRHIRKGRRFHDVVGLGMLREEWLAARAASHARLAAKGHALPLGPDAP